MIDKLLSALAVILVVAGILVGLYASVDERQVLPESTRAVVRKVVDGDTIKVVISGKESTVRIIGIDTPETKHPEKGVECWGPEASALAIDLLAGKTVSLKYSQLGQEVDRYGRTLAYVHLPDGSDYGLRAIKAGSTRLYESEAHDRQQEYRRAVKAAERAGKGLWSACELKGR